MIFPGVGLRGLGITVILILHGDLDPADCFALVTMVCSYPGERRAVTVAKTYSNGELDADYGNSTGSHTAIVNFNRKKHPAADWIHVAASLCCRVLSQDGYFHKRCILSEQKETLLYISELVGSGSFIVVLP